MATVRSLRIHARTGFHAIAIATTVSVTTAAMSTTSGIEEPDGCTTIESTTDAKIAKPRSIRRPTAASTMSPHNAYHGRTIGPSATTRASANPHARTVPIFAARHSRYTTPTTVVTAAAVRTRLSTWVSWPTTAAMHCATNVVGL